MKSQISTGTLTQGLWHIALTIEQMRPDILTDSHTPVNQVTFSPLDRNVSLNYQVQSLELRKYC